MTTPLNTPVLGLNFTNGSFITTINGVVTPGVVVPDNRGLNQTLGLQVDTRGLVICNSTTPPPINTPAKRMAAIYANYSQGLAALTAVENAWNAHNFLLILRYEYIYFQPQPPERLYNIDNLFNMLIGNIGATDDKFVNVGIANGDSGHILPANKNVVIFAENSIYETNFESANTVVLAAGDTTQMAMYCTAANLSFSQNASATETQAFTTTYMPDGINAGQSGINFQFNNDDFGTNKRLVFAGIYSVNIDVALDLPAYSDPAFNPFPVSTLPGQMILGALGS